jgi:hypothetical protein
MVEVKQKFNQPRLTDYRMEIKKELAGKGLKDRIKTGDKIAITAGSRGIANIAEILAVVVEEVKKAGGEPFLIPAMGSHGGSTPEGQVKVLESLGITPSTVGAPIQSSMEIDEIGCLEGTIVVSVDKNALSANGIIVVNRVKPHTDFKGKIESGLLKMISIGLGKQKGAEMIHWYQKKGYHQLISDAAKLIIEKTPILMGLALIENAYHETAIVKALLPEEFESEEIKLLEIAKELLPRIPFKEIDVLVVEEIGKNISGVGMDTNVTGRFWLEGESSSRASKIKKIVVLNLSDQTHGNAIGIGLADFTTRRVFENIDYDSTYVNCLTQGSSDTAKIPPFLSSDKDVIATALRTAGPINPKKAKVVRIKNTLELGNFWVSEKLADIIKTDEELKGKLEIYGDPREMKFDVLGTLTR